VADDLATVALKIAVAEAAEGPYETPALSNRGPRIDEYQTGRATLGQPWCLKFVHWCYTQAAARLEVKNPLPHIFLVSSFLEWARKEGKVVDDPHPGDILVQKPAKHVGLLLKMPVASIFSSVEGNTYTTDPSKEGVYIREKRHVENYFFVRV
jgi:hypothetical protein